MAGRTHDQLVSCRRAWSVAPRAVRPARRQTQRRTTLAVIVFLLSATLLALNVLLRLTPAVLAQWRPPGFFDLKVYRAAAGVVASGGHLYDVHFHLGLGFTYPPIAALMFLGLRAASLATDEVAVTLANITLVAVIAHCTLRLRRQSSVGIESASHPATAWLLAAIALWTEPVRSAIGFGQIDVLVAALVLIDLTVVDHNSRWGGLGVGIAAALKLTPLIFILYLAFTGRGRSAARALGMFLASVIVSFVSVPRDAASYWGGTFLDTSRVTGGSHLTGSGPADQSLRGALLRIAPGVSHMTLLWVITCLLVASLGLFLATRAGRRGDEAGGFVLTAITGLLISPISWTHHWVIAVPGLLLLLAPTERSLLRVVAAIAAAVLAVGSSTITLVIAESPGGHDLGTLGLLVGDLYVIIGLMTIATAAAIQAATRHRRPQADLPCIIPPNELRPLPLTDPVVKRGDTAPLALRELK
jgi:alpha-1,2-mannosyltransferase